MNKISAQIERERERERESKRDSPSFYFNKSIKDTVFEQCFLILKNYV